MAEAIATSLLADAPQTRSITEVGSAGVGAAEGEQTTFEAVQALNRLGVPPTAKRSRALTRDLIVQADAIFGMTRSHVRAILALTPDARGKVELLDPDGEDIPDPIGGDQSVYTQAAERIRRAIQRRIKEQRL